jgi:hypothetical protein
VFRIELGTYDFTLVGYGSVLWMDDPDAKEEFPPSVHGSLDRWLLCKRAEIGALE